jgi:hypothetical protein
MAAPEPELIWPVQMFLDDLFIASTQSDKDGRYEGLPEHIILRNGVTADRLGEVVLAANWNTKDLLQVTRPMLGIDEDTSRRVWQTDEGVPVLFRATLGDMIRKPYRFPTAGGSEYKVWGMEYAILADKLCVSGNLCEGGTIAFDVPFDEEDRYARFAGLILGVIEPKHSLAAVTIGEFSPDQFMDEEPPTTE